MEKIADHVFFLVRVIPLFGVKIRMKSDASFEPCMLMVLKLHLWIPHGKIGHPYFFLVRVISLSGAMPL